MLTTEVWVRTRPNTNITGLLVPSQRTAKCVDRRCLTLSIHLYQCRGGPPPRKLPVLGRNFHLLPFFNKKRNPDLKTSLQPGKLGHAAARGVALHRRFGVGDIQLDE